MKRIGNLYHKIYDIENIKLAHKNARKNKTHYTEVKEVDSNIEYYCQEISDMIKSKKFRNGEYTTFIKNDKGKEREIYKLPYYPDRIVHHAIMQVLEPIWKKTFISNTYQSIKGRGVHKAKKAVLKGIQELNSDIVYYGQIDISKFYPSVNNKIMESIIAKKIKCKDTLWLLNTIVYSMKGLPIGNYLSQYLGNLYLTYLDHYIKETMRVKYYYRYCDDIVILGTSKDYIIESVNTIVTKINELDLQVKPDRKIDTTENGLDFLGFVFYTRYTLLRNRIARNFKSAVRRFKQKPTLIKFSSVISYYGWVISSDCYNLWNKYINVKFKSILCNMNVSNKVIRS